MKNTAEFITAQEIKTMLKIKYLIENLLAFLLILFRIFPLKKRVIFSSFSGRQYSDSPKAISDYILENYPEIEVVWAFINPKDFLVDSKIIKVKYKSLRYLYYALTSRVYVDNVEIWSLLRFRKGQTAIETWHGGGAYKRVGIDRLDVGDAHKKHSVDKMNRMDIFLSSGRMFTEKVIRSAFGFKGEVLEVGLPRNDRLKNSTKEDKNRIKEVLGIEADKKVLIYAPTFRNSLSLDPYSLDIEALNTALKEKFGGEWIVLLRLHYYMDNKLFKSNAQNTIDVTSYPDMQELLMVSDLLITDYSSSMWDFSLNFKPCFLYATDIKEYSGERDFYTAPKTWPFPLAESNESLLQNIKDFDITEYAKRVAEHHLAFGSSESGSATKIISDRIKEILN